MANVLPKAYKEKLRAEYRLRLAAATLLFLAGILLLSLLILVSSYLIVRSQENSVQSRIDLLEAVTQRQAETEEGRLVELIVKKLNYARTPLAPVVTPYISEVLGKQNDSIALRGLSYVRGTEFDQNPGERTLVISGVADSRQALIAFKEALESVSDFEEVDLPVSALAQDRDVDFSLTIKFVLAD